MKLKISRSDPDLIEATKDWLVRGLKIDYAVEDQLLPFIQKEVLPLRPLKPPVYSDLMHIESSGEPFPESPYRPAQARLNDGRELSAVLFISDVVYFYLWDLDSEKPFVSADRIDGISDSVLRLPPTVARKIYSFGETGMGSLTFELVTRQGNRFPCWFSNVAEFAQLPGELESRDVVDAVSPHRKPDPVKDLRQPGFAWCVYLETPENVRRLESQMSEIDFNPEEYLALRPEIES